MLALAPVLPECSRSRDNVVEQVRRRDRGARRAEDAHLEREKKHCPRNTSRNSRGGDQEGGDDGDRFY